jgi:glycosyltransferase involved in cell wall biosynthesis
MSFKDLVIISNEKIYKTNQDFYCDNLDLKVLPEGLNKHYIVNYIVRHSKKKGDQKIDLKNIKIGSNIFKFIYFVFKTIKKSNTKYLLVCITPYTFLAFLLLALFRKDTFVYLFSSGHEEYKHILGKYFVWIYDFMYRIVTFKSKVIVCHERLHDKQKSHLIHISRLDEKWFQKHKGAPLDKIRLLYVGRMSPEKGIFDFLKMFKEIKFNAQLSIAGDPEDTKISEPNIKFLGYIADPISLIDVYDNHNILILPSYTEATPYVVDESLSRKRPVIIFKDIEYIVRGKKGIFVIDRNKDSFLEMTKYIMENYTEIQNDMKNNILPTKNDMIKQISDIIKYQNFK